MRGSQFRIPTLEAKKGDCESCAELKRQIKALRFKVEEIKAKGTVPSDAGEGRTSGRQGC